MKLNVFDSNNLYQCKPTRTAMVTALAERKVAHRPDPYDYLAIQWVDEHGNHFGMGFDADGNFSRVYFATPEQHRKNAEHGAMFLAKRRAEIEAVWDDIHALERKTGWKFYD